MATVAPTIEKFGDDAVAFTWTLTSTDSDGAPVGPQYMSYADRCVQVSGTQGSPAAVAAIQGSNDGTNWGTDALNDLFGTNITGSPTLVSTAPVISIAETPLYTRPVLTTAGTGASIKFVMFMRKARSGRAIGG